MTYVDKFVTIAAVDRLTRPIAWIKAARKDFEDFPPGVRGDALDALSAIAEGVMPSVAKPLTGLGSGVMELALRHRGDAWRVIYALRIGAEIWVIHAFQTKAKAGIKTPQTEIELVRDPLKRLREILR